MKIIKNNTWTDLRIELEKIIANRQLAIRPLGIYEYPGIEYRVVKHFTGDESWGMSWMWENRVKKNFISFSRHCPDFSIIASEFLANIKNDEQIWFFIEDSLRQKSKFWGYSGCITDFVGLLEDLPLADFYFVSKNERTIALLYMRW